MRIRYRSRDPLLDAQLRKVPLRSPLDHALKGTFDQNDFKRWLVTWDKKTRHMTKLKPPTYLGAPWIDESAANKRAVSLCADCERKYQGWDKKMGYNRRSVTEISDCDGCGQTLQECAGFYPALIQ